MSDNIKLEFDTKQLTKLLRGLPDGMQEKIVRNALSAGARKFAKSAGAEAPVGDGRAKGGTNLKEHIKVSWDRKLKEVHVGVKSRNAFYAHMVEYGTVNKTPDPFFRRTYTKELGAMINTIFLNMAKGIAKQAEKFKNG